MMGITIEDGELVVRPAGLNRAVVARNELRVKLSDIESVHAQPSLQASDTIFNTRMTNVSDPLHRDRPESVIVVVGGDQPREIEIGVLDAYGAAEAIAAAVKDAS